MESGRDTENYCMHIPNKTVYQSFLTSFKLGLKTVSSFLKLNKLFS